MIQLVLKKVLPRWMPFQREVFVFVLFCAFIIIFKVSNNHCNNWTLIDLVTLSISIFYQFFAGVYVYSIFPFLQV